MIRDYRDICDHNGIAKISITGVNCSFNVGDPIYCTGTPNVFEQKSNTWNHGVRKPKYVRTYNPKGKRVDFSPPQVVEWLNATPTATRRALRERFGMALTTANRYFRKWVKGEFKGGWKSGN